MNDEEERMPVLDKLDYRGTLKTEMENCLHTVGTIYFPTAVKRLMLALETKFPNMDFKTPIEKEKNKLLEEYYEKLDRLKQNPEIWYHPLKHRGEEYAFAEEYHTKLFCFIRDLLAANRGLLFGRSDSKGMEYDEV